MNSTAIEAPAGANLADIPLPDFVTEIAARAEERYQTFVALMSAHQTNHLRAVQLQGVIDRTLQNLVEKHRTTLVEIEARQKILTAQIKALVLSNRDWMGDAKSIKTPFGTTKLTETSSLEPVNEELSIMLIRDFLDKHQADVLIRQKEELNLAALSNLDDASLMRIKVKRVTGESFKIEPAKASVTKAPKAAKASKEKEVA